MRKRHRYTLFLAGAAAAALAVVPAAIGGGHQDLLRSGVAGSVGPGGPKINEVLPAGKPWVVNRHSTIRLKRNGELRAKVRGLVIPIFPTPNPLAGPHGLVAAVACNGAVVAMTDGVDFSAAGDGKIREKLDLPSPCLAPAVFFVTPTGAYIAASG
jgi:hypothetical protein